MKELSKREKTVFISLKSDHPLIFYEFLTIFFQQLDLDIFQDFSKLGQKHNFRVPYTEKEPPQETKTT